MKPNPFLRTLLAVALLAFLIPAAAHAEPGDDHILKGNKFVQKKELQKAVAEYEEALKVSPSHPKAHLLLGMTYANLGDFEKAEKALQTSIQSQPSYVGFYTLGLVYANKSDLAKAIEAFQNAIQINPTAYRGWYQLGQIHLANGDFKSAIDDYKKSVELNPRFWDAYQGLGVAYFWSGEKLLALEQVNQLKMVKAKEKALQLEKWIEAKEAQKQNNARPAAPAATPA